MTTHGREIEGKCYTRENAIEIAHELRTGILEDSVKLARTFSKMGESTRNVSNYTNGMVIYKDRWDFVTSRLKMKDEKIRTWPLSFRIALDSRMYADGYRKSGVFYSRAY